jgi:hypothetical protein
MIVPGRTIEGGWPFVKVMNFGLAGLKLAATDGGGRAVVSEFASPEQLQQGTVDFRSEIYSLGATMCFLLTGAFYSAEPRSLQTRRFAKPLRRLIAPMLRQNPDERPQDPVLFAQSARSCLGKIERRQALQSRFGIPFVGVKAKPVKNIPTRRPMPLVGPEIMSRSGPIPLPVSETMAPSVMATPKVWLSRKALVIAAVLLAATAVAAVLLPAPVNMILRRNRDVTEIGVPVGVPDASGTRTQQSAPGVARANTNAPATTVAQNADSNPPVSSQNLVTAKPSPNVSGSEIMSSAKHPAPAVASANRSSPSAARSSTTDQSPASSPIPPPKQDSSPAGETSSVVSRPHAPERNQSTSASQATASPSRMIAAAEAATKPAAPAEGPQTVWERAAGESGRAKLSTQNATVDRDSPSTEGNSGNENALENKSEDDATPAPSKPRHKSKAIASTTTHEPQASEEDSTPFLQDNDDAESRPHRNGEAARPPRNSFNRSQEIDGSRRSQTSGTVHARYVGTTPNGDLILRLPSGETAIVSPRAARLTVAPRHRVRRVVERHSTYLPPPPPPYLPGN